MRRAILGVALLFALIVPVVLITPAWSAEAHWVGTWGAAPQPPSPAMGVFPGTPSFDGQTVRQVLRLSVGGSRLRIRLSNEYGSKPIEIGDARISAAMPNGRPKGKPIRITFAGQSATRILPGAPVVSDPIDMPTKDLETVSISLYLVGNTGPCTCHATAMQNAFVSKPGDFTKKLFQPVKTIGARPFVSRVDVDTSAPAKAIVALGDSITDGIGSTPGANERWPDLLADRLEARDARQKWGVVNVGISGNQLLADGAGQSALARFDRDVLSAPGVAYVIVFEGINDIGLSYGHFTGPMAKFMKRSMPTTPVTAAELIAGYKQIIERAHLHGLKVFGATITPYKGSAYYSSKGEKVREAVNHWIRTSHAFDGVLDFDAVMRDPKDPLEIKGPLQRGDHLHGSDAGYKAIADSINLRLFQ